MALSGPSDLVVTPLSSTSIYLVWQNNGQYDRIYVERESPIDGGFVEIYYTDGSDNEYCDIELDPNTEYNYQVRGYRFYPEEWSPYSNEDDATTYGVLEDPTDLEAEAFADFIDITFKDNSGTEDDHRLERKVGTGEFSEYATIPANMDFYRDTSVTPGETYTYRARAKQGVSYSPGYSNEDSAIALSAPSIPTSPTLSEVKDKSMRFSWTAPVAGDPLTGYKVQISDEDTFGGEETEYIVATGVVDFLFTGLAPNDQYWVRVCSYNGVGSSAFTSSVNDTTDAQYEFTDFEKFIRKPKIEIVALCEINPGKKLSGFTLTGGKTYTYELAITDRAIVDFEKVYENGEEYAEKASINEVEATASTFWFDTSTRILYVHTSTGADPIGFYNEGRFWTYFSNKKNMTFNGNFYLPFLSLENIPSMNSEINAFYGGSFKIASGTISLKNDEETSKKFFDKRFADYLWSDAKLVLKIGKEGFAYSKYEEAFTSLIDRVDCNDRLISLNLKDLRANLSGRIPVNKYQIADFPAMDGEKEGAVIPRVFRYGRNIPSVCIDTENKKWSFHDGRIKEVNTVKVNDAVKTKDTHYYVDYQRAVITFARTMEMDWEKDTVDIEFIGMVDSANAAVVDGAEIFKSIMNEIMGLSNDELDHDSIYGTKYDTSLDLSVQIYKEENLADIINKIENSVRASTFQDEKGRIGLRVAQSVPASDAVYVENFHISEDGHKQEKGAEFLFKEINIYYAEDPGKEKPEVFTKSLPKFVWKYGKRKPLKSLDIDTYFISDTSASALADDIATKLEELEAGFINETLPWMLYGCRAGDVIILSRDRFYGSSGVADKINVRLLKLDKIISSGKSTIKGVIVS